MTNCKPIIGNTLILIIIAFCATTRTAGADNVDPHAAHRAMAQSKAGVQRSTQAYETPKVTGIDESGQLVVIEELLDSDTPVIFNFIFTSCQTICPILSATFSQAQESLAAVPDAPKLVSFSIDPEYDTPERLNSYAKQFRAGDNWQFVTGDSDAMLSVQKSFDAYRGDKLNHVALTYMRKSSADPWVRYQGFMSASDLVKAYTALDDFVASSK